MKIFYAGGERKGSLHIILAVMERVEEVVSRERFINVKQYIGIPHSTEKKHFFNLGATHIRTPLGSVLSQFVGYIRFFFTFLFLYPDVVFCILDSYSLPVVRIARLFRIPLFVFLPYSTVDPHLKKYLSKAITLACAYPEIKKEGPSGKIIYTGMPVRRDIEVSHTAGAHDYFGFDSYTPTILFFSGNSPETINDATLAILPRLLEKYQVLHQVGVGGKSEIEKQIQVILKDSPHRARYKIYEYMEVLDLRMAASVVNLVVSHSGLTLFESAIWGAPTIVIPDPAFPYEKEDAYLFARSGSGVVIEPQNMYPEILFSEIARILEDTTIRSRMMSQGSQFSPKGAGLKIAEELLIICLKHELGELRSEDVVQKGSFGVPSLNIEIPTGGLQK